MAYGQVSVGGVVVGCGRNGGSACPGVQEPGEETKKAFLAINEFVERTLTEAGLVDQDYQIQAVERTDGNDLIGVKMVTLGRGKLTLTVSLVAGVITLGIMTTAADELPAADIEGSTSVDGTARLAAEFRAGWQSTCGSTQEQLARERGSNPDAMPIEAIVDTLKAQLEGVKGLTPPPDLAGLHAELQAAIRNRIALLEKVVTDGQAADPEEIRALLQQADVSATQAQRAFEALGVEECVEQ